MSDDVKGLVRYWCRYEASRRLGEEISRLEDELERLRTMSPEEYLRRGIEDVCPRDVPPTVREYLQVNDLSVHFSVRADPGNEGLRLEVTQGQYSWDHVEDPWREEFVPPAPVVDLNPQPTRGGTS